MTTIHIMSIHDSEYLIVMIAKLRYCIDIEHVINTYIDIINFPNFMQYMMIKCTIQLNDEQPNYIGLICITMYGYTMCVVAT